MSGQVVPKIKSAKSKKRPYKADNQTQTDQEEKEYGMLGKSHLELVAAGIMDIEALTYIRGRSIPNQYMIIDEAQNLTPHEIKTIITRAGINTKLIFTGDPAQIDNPYLDASSNGLTYLVEKFKDEAIAGHMTLTQGERSELAEIASNIL
jgi:PhoH-like ATPase